MERGHPLSAGVCSTLISRIGSWCSGCSRFALGRTGCPRSISALGSRVWPSLTVGLLTVSAAATDLS